MIKYVFISGPYTNGGQLANTTNAINLANELRELGYVPIIPHLFHFWDAIHAHDWQYWMDICYEYLALADVLYRLPGESVGADLEVKRARELKKPIVQSIGELVRLV